MNDEPDSQPRRHDDATTRRPSGLRLRSPLSDEDEAIVARVMDSLFAVHRALGPGFRELIYHRACCLELDSRGISYESEKLVEVKYRQWSIPGHKVDLLVDRRVLVELKAVPKLTSLHRDQVISYLKALDLRIGLLVNFNVPVLKDGFKRVLR